MSRAGLGLKYQDRVSFGNWSWASTGPKHYCLMRWSSHQSSGLCQDDDFVLEQVWTQMFLNQTVEITFWTFTIKFTRVSVGIELRLRPWVSHSSPNVVASFFKFCFSFLRLSCLLPLFNKYIYLRTKHHCSFALLTWTLIKTYQCVTNLAKLSWLFQML